MEPPLLCEVCWRDCDLPGQLWWHTSLVSVTLADSFESCWTMGRTGHRGLFPFPVPKVADPVRVEEQVNRRVLRRLEARCHVDEWVRDIIVSLNSLFMGCDDMGSFEGNMRPTLSQRICTSQMRRAVLDVGKPPADVSGQGALSELRVHSNYMGDPVALAPLEIDLVSLPPAGSKAAEMDLVFGEEARNYTHRITSKILAEGDVRVLKAELGLKKPYVDPALRGSPKLYADFCRKLNASGLIEFRETFTEQVGAFMVWKKSGKQRLVIDARLANLHFGTPEKVSLATGATFANIEVDSGPPLEVGGVDIADAFYHLELIPELRGFFALPGVRAGDVGCSMVNGKKISETSKIYPCLKVVPMGWTHALWLCQAAHEHIVNLCPRVDSRLRCRDKRPVPEVKDYIHTQYVDNFVALSQKPGRARELAEEIGVKLNERGLPTHEVEAGKGIETLGWLFSASHPTVTVTPKRLWKLRLGTKELLRVGKASGKTIEKLVGHYTFAGLLQRGFLSCFQATYVFIRKHYESEVPLWPEVSRELFWAASLICLVRRDLSSPWSTRVHATDASTWGRGIVSTQRNVEDIKALGRRCDRWRFTVEEEKNVLRNELTEVADAIDAETLEMKRDAQLDQVGIGDTLEVPLNFIGEDWGKVDGSAWDRQEAIPILEGRCIVWLLQHLARSQKNLNKKHLVLSDSMSVVLALSKGRSSAGAMNRVCRQVAALELATGMHVHTRWLPSELNPADLPSRAQAIGDFSLEEGLDKFRENHAEASRKGRSRGWRTSALQFHQGWCRDEVGTWSLRREELGGSPTGDGAGFGGRQGDSHETAKPCMETTQEWWAWTRRPTWNADQWVLPGRRATRGSTRCSSIGVRRTTSSTRSWRSWITQWPIASTSCSSRAGTRQMASLWLRRWSTSGGTSTRWRFSRRPRQRWKGSGSWNRLKEGCLSLGPCYAWSWKTCGRPPRKRPCGCWWLGQPVPGQGRPWSWGRRIWCHQARYVLIGWWSSMHLALKGSKGSLETWTQTPRSQWSPRQRLGSQTKLSWSTSHTWRASGPWCETMPTSSNPRSCCSPSTCTRQRWSSAKSWWSTTMWPWGSTARTRSATAVRPTMCWQDWETSARSKSEAGGWPQSRWEGIPTEEGCHRSSTAWAWSRRPKHPPPNVGLQRFSKVERSETTLQPDWPRAL